MLLRVNAAELQRQRESKNMTPYRLAVEASGKCNLPTGGRNYQND